MTKVVASTGDTQPICVERPFGLVEWCIEMTDDALRRQRIEIAKEEAKATEPTPVPKRPTRRTDKKAA